MKKKIALLCAIILSIVNCIPVYASAENEKFVLSKESYSKEIIKNTVINEDLLGKNLEYFENEYDLSLNMPTEVVEDLSVIANVSKSTQRIDEDHIQMSYTIYSKEPIVERTFVSGNTEKIYSVTNYTYVMSSSTVDSGEITESSALSDVTFKNTAYYSFYEDGTLRMIRLDSGKTSITRFLESNLRDLVLSAYCIGGSDNGFQEESNTRTITSPGVGRSHTLDTEFEYFYSTSAARILYGASVTYSHGLSSYTVSAQISLGN